MDGKNILLSEVKLRKAKVACFLSNVKIQIYKPYHIYIYMPNMFPIVGLLEEIRG
jgi:hypothetical protein